MTLGVLPSGRRRAVVVGTFDRKSRGPHHAARHLCGFSFGSSNFGLVVLSALVEPSSSRPRTQAFRCNAKICFSSAHMQELEDGVPPAPEVTQKQKLSNSCTRRDPTTAVRPLVASMETPLRTVTYAFFLRRAVSRTHRPGAISVISQLDDAWGPF